MIEIDFTQDKETLYIVLGLLLWATVVQIIALDKRLRSWKGKNMEKSILALFWEVELFRNLLSLIVGLLIVALVYVVLQ